MITEARADQACPPLTDCSQYLDTIELYEQAVQAQEEEIEQLAQANEALRIDIQHMAEDTVKSPILPAISCVAGTVAATSAASNRIGAREAAFSAAGAIVCLGIMELFK